MSNDIGLGSASKKKNMPISSHHKATYTTINSVRKRADSKRLNSKE